MRRLIQISIRDIVWLTVVAGMACGWYGHSVSQSAQWNFERDKLLAEQETLKERMFNAKREAQLFGAQVWSLRQDLKAAEERSFRNEVKGLVGNEDKGK
jgi:hypothetical protein